MQTALAARRDRLDPADLTRLGEATWWLGNAPGAMEVAEEAFQRLAEAGRESEAADHALRLALAWMLRGDVAISHAWLSRAKRLLADLPPGVLHGYLAYIEGSQDTDLTGDPMPCRTAAETLDQLNERFGDPALQTLSVALRGMAGVLSGDSETGWAALDESILPLLNGCLEPMWTGDLLCSVVHLCDELGDLARAQQWTGVMARWSTPLSQTFMYADVVRVHELALAAAAGEWDLVEHELGNRADDLVGAHGWLAGEAYYTLGEVRRLRGDREGADTAFGQARALQHDAQPGTALRLRSDGHFGEALESLRIALADQVPLRRARVLLPMIEMLLEAGDQAYAATLAAEAEATAAHFASPGLRAVACRARAAVRLATGLPGLAVPLLEEAGQIYRDQRHRYPAAQVHERLAEARDASGDDARAAAEVATAAAIYRSLGAAPDLERLSPAEPPAGLTGREVEVLLAVSRGGTNKDIAAELFISEKTVGRHLANIYTKLGVSSRTAAASWARDQRL